MRFIGTKTHGYLDYLVGFLLIISPWLFGFYRGEMESWIPVLLGISAMLYSFFTDYELGVKKNISMKTHLTLDVVSGILLALSPWIFRFSEYVYLPHLIIGIGEIGVALMTRKIPYQHYSTAASP